MIATNSYSFQNDDKDSDKREFNFTPLIYGTVILISTLNINNVQSSFNIEEEKTVNSIRSLDLTKEQKATTLPLHNNQLKKSDSLNSVNLTNDDIMSIEEEIEEVLDVEELNRLNNKFDIFSEKFHDSQIENTEKLTTLTTKMDSVQNELSRLNETQQRLPERIRDELSKLQSEKKDNNKNIWIAPLVTGITSGIVVGIVVAVALYYMGIS